MSEARYLPFFWPFLQTICVLLTLKIIWKIRGSGPDMVRLPCLTISVSFRICSLSAYTGIAQGKILRAEPLGLKRWIWGFQVWDLGRQIAGIRYLSWIGSRLMQMHPKRTCLLAKQFFLGPVAEVSRYLQTANAANRETIRRIHAIDQLPSLMYSNPQKDRNVGHLKNMKETSSRMTCPIFQISFCFLQH